jgi:hypothetical protein
MYRNIFCGCAAVLLLSACGTTYQMPEIAAPELSRAEAIIAQ